MEPKITVMCTVSCTVGHGKNIIVVVVVVVVVVAN